jgi:hypothetical protein
MLPVLCVINSARGMYQVGFRCWRKLHNEELHNLYYSANIIRMMKSRRMRWAGHVARMRAKSNAYRIKIPLGRQRRRWVDNIKIHLREIGWDDMDWISLAQDSFEHGNEPSGSIKCLQVFE